MHLVTLVIESKHNLLVILCMVKKDKFMVIKNVKFAIFYVEVMWFISIFVSTQYSEQLANTLGFIAV